MIADSISSPCMLALGLLVASYFVAVQGQYVTAPLANARYLEVVLPYDNVTKIQTAIQIQNMMKIYVNRQSKIANYNVDPLPIINEIVQNAGNMSNLEFNRQLSKMYLSLRDFHTNYYIPGAHACVALFKQMQFDMILERSSSLEAYERKIIFSRDTPITERSSNNTVAPKAGDELVAVDGVPVLEYLGSKMGEFGGAGYGPGLDAAVRGLSYISGGQNSFPAENSNVFQLKSASTGDLYEIELPWLAGWDSYCLGYANNVTVSMGGEPINEPSNLLAVTVEKPSKPIRTIRKSRNIGVNSFYEQWKEDVGARKDNSKLVFSTSKEYAFQWAIYQPDDANIGILKILSFYTSATYGIESVNVVRDLLLGPLRNTSSLIIDIRQNGGGFIDLANQLPQLFTPHFESGGFRAIVDDVNLEIFNRTGDFEWVEAMRSTEHLPYSSVVRLTPLYTENYVGMAYSKPVGVFTDNNCYSACSLFAANMQDSGAAVIYGEDYTTGGGSANVVEWKSYFKDAAPKYFQPFPAEQYYQFNYGGPNARLAWRQMLRSGPNNGKDFEDVNVLTDKLVPLTREELIGATPNTQYGRIGEDLMRESLLRGSVLFETKQNLYDLYFVGNYYFEVYTKGIRRIVVKDQNDTVVGATHVKIAKVFKMSSIKVPFNGTTNFFSSGYKIYCYSISDELVFQTSRYVNRINQAVIAAGSIFNVNIFGYPEYSNQIDLSSPGFGWIRSHYSLKIAANGTYANDVDSEINYYLRIEAPTSISIEATYDVEEYFDFFYFGYEKDDEIVHFLQKQSDTGLLNGTYGQGELNNSYELPAGEVRVFLRFVSDIVGGATGVSVAKLTIGS